MKKSWSLLIKILSIVLGTISIMLLGAYFGLRIWIKSDFNRICSHATETSGINDKSKALVFILKSESQDLNAKNDAIWALEYVKDTIALPVLRELQNGKECDHSNYVCQRELKRAIENLEGKNTRLIRFN